MSDDEPAGLKPGEIVTARVKRVAAFGLFLDYRGLDLLLLIPETSWIACYASCDQLADVGDEFRVRILAYAVDRDQYAVSHKAVYPDSIPWSGPGGLKVGETREATVVRAVERADRCSVGKGWLLELRPGAYVMMCGHGEAGWQRGDRCRVTVTVVDQARWIVTVRLAS